MMTTLEEIFQNIKQYSKVHHWQYAVNGEEPQPINPVTVQFLSALNNLGDKSILGAFLCGKPSDHYIERLIEVGYVSVFTDKNHQYIKVSDDMKKAEYIHS